MANSNDGGPAFPAPSVYVDENICPRQVEQGELGMTLRDYFAAAAMTGWLTGLSHDAQLPEPEYVAENCYDFADAMLKARAAE